MQSLKWYAHRLRVMSSGEVVWRMRSAMRDATDRYCLILGRYQNRTGAESESMAVLGPPGFRVCDLAVGGWVHAGPDQPEYQWLGHLLTRANQVVNHKLSFFDLEECDLGSPIDWNRDHKSGKKAPMDFSPSIDYRDFNVTGDAKYVWEPNRHHQLVILGRAYRASGVADYAKALIDQLGGWMAACPFGLGMNWRSPLELSVRLINWVWAIDLIRDAGLMDEAFTQKFLRTVHLHLWEITRKYSRGSSTNNHLIGEAAGVFIASGYFSQFRQAVQWQKQSSEILCREILTQISPDGVNREQAIGYHLFVLRFYLLVGLVARRIGWELPKSFWDRLERMLEFVGTLSEGGTELPWFGDSDDGYVLNLGSQSDDVRSLLAVGVTLFDRSDFKTWSAGFTEPAWWLTGDAGRLRYGAIKKLGDTRLHSRAFPYAGFYLLQYGTVGSPDRISVTLDCGAQGLAPLAGHGHADALNFTLRAFGGDVFIDPGTYDYFSYPRWRQYFKSTRAHNTIEIDGKDQAVMRGSFMWNPQADGWCVEWQPDDNGGYIIGEHDGYRRLQDPVIHRRTLSLKGRERKLMIHDSLICKGRHTAMLAFHLAERCRMISRTSHHLEIDTGLGRVFLEIDPAWTVEILYGSNDPIGGWVSRGYHRKVKTTTLLARAAIVGTTDFICRIEL